MSTSTAVRISQVTDLLTIVEEFSQRDVHQLLANQDLLRILLGANNLDRVDRAAFAQLLDIPQARFEWNSVESYVPKIYAWNDRYELGLTRQQIDAVLYAAPPHRGIYQPTSVLISTDRGPAYDLSLILSILREELRKHGITFIYGFDTARITYIEGSELEGSAPLFRAIPLDLQKYWSPSNQNTVIEQRRYDRVWPTFEAAWLLALNPHMFAYLNGATLPRLGMVGVDCGSRRMPILSFNSDGTASMSPVTENTIPKNTSFVARGC